MSGLPNRTSGIWTLTVRSSDFGRSLQFRYQTLFYRGLKVFVSLKNFDLKLFAGHSVVYSESFGRLPSGHLCVTSSDATSSQLRQHRCLSQPHLEAHQGSHPRNHQGKSLHKYSMAGRILVGYVKAQQLGARPFTLYAELLLLEKFLKSLAQSVNGFAQP